ncbi:MAG TPA: MBL fold metallo-hydrolase [Reyranella sp.]|nr:MBL fold metallo-hydrolase [Reyranella sp.]
MYAVPVLCLIGLLLAPIAVSAQNCGRDGVALQVLGSGGPGLQDRRASSSYLVWQNGRARVLIDAGGGSALRFGESGATMSQLDLMLFSHFHIDHSADFPALIKSSWFEDRNRPLPIYGPGGNDFMPSTTEFVAGFFDDKRGVYRYLGELLAPEQASSYKMQPHDVLPGTRVERVFAGGNLAASAGAVIHGAVPALAWRIDIGGKSIAFSGDTDGEGTLARVANEADMLVAHNAVPEDATGVERRLHMPPSVIGRIASQAKVKSLILSHRMLRTLGREKETEAAIRKAYQGRLSFANDLDCFPVR